VETLFAPLERRRALLTAVFVALVVLANGLALGARRYARSPTPWGADAGAYCRIAEAMVTRGSVELPPPDRLPPDPQVHVEEAWGTPYALTVGARVLPKHSLLYAALLAPGFLLGGTFGAIVAALVLSALLAGFVAARIAARLGALAAVAATLVLFLLVPPARLVVLAINVDVALALFMVVAYAAASERRPALAGAVAGAALFLRPTSPLLFLPLAALLGRDRRAWGRFLAAAAPSVLLFAVSNALLWGAPWRTAYERGFVSTPHGWSLATHSALFGGDALAGLRLLFLDARGGLLATAPVMLLGAFGYAFREARRAEWLGATAGGALALLALAPYRFLSVVPEFNARFALPLLVSLAPPLAALLAGLLTRARLGRGRPPSS